MTTNNNCLVVAAYRGALYGSLAGRQQSSAIASNYAALAAACLAFAEEVDSQITQDATITTGSGSSTIIAIVTAENTQIGPIMEKVNLLADIVAAQVQGRILTDMTPTNYLALAAACAAIYTESVTTLSTFVP